MSLMSFFLLCSIRRTVRKSLLEEVQELEARAVDPGAAVLRDASGRRYIDCCKASWEKHSYSQFYLCHRSVYYVDFCLICFMIIV